MARQPGVEPRPPLSDASKLACLGILFSGFSLSTVYFNCINPPFPWLSYKPLSNNVAFQNPFRYAFIIHMLGVTCPL
jgi:hypothetical protein